MYHYIYPIIILSFIIQSGFAQPVKTDANIIGHVASDGQHVPYASISLKGTTLGTVSDETGHYQLINLPEGRNIIVVSSVGYKSVEKEVTLKSNQSIEIKFELEEDHLHIDEVVVSANRAEVKRTEAPVIVNTISTKIFRATQSQTLSEGLNFSPGLRLENNCQNCGFTQVRLNGMEGPYTQILINSRPIFSGLAGVYGLELIPSNLIDKVEVVRGGGSALFGSNAIAGTINIIMKDPVQNSYETGINLASTGVAVDGSGGPAPNYSAVFNTSLVSDDHKTGMALFGYTCERQMFDANSDNLSEIAPINNLTLGTRIYHRFGYRNRLSADFFTIREQRDGGNKQDYPLHERDLAEAVKHKLIIGGLTYEQYFRKYDLFSIYVSGQFLERDSYYGANQSLSDYGHSYDKTYTTGAQYKALFGPTSLIAGIENTGGFLTDKKLGYPDYDNVRIAGDSITEVSHIENILVADQSSITTGIFSQYEMDWKKLKIAIGARFDSYEVKDLTKDNEYPKTGQVFSPRISILYELWEPLQFRVSYSEGYRAPQIFDEDLHIETSGSRQVINQNDPNLTQETSRSITVSFDFNKLIETVYTGLLVEGFYTRLENPFVNEIGIPDEDGTVIYTRKNAQNGATVQGLNMEFKLRPLKAFSMTSGFTLQTSVYDVPQEFDEKHFFRAPDRYGYFASDWDVIKNFCISANGTYTGPMLVPYFGPDADPDIGELHSTNDFFDLGIKLSYTMKLNGASLQWSAGIKNILNAYQSDFDTGIDRDPAYMYGPVLPRTVYFELKFGNLL